MTAGSNVRLAVWYPPLLARKTAEVSLTARQADVLTGLTHGLTNHQIARRLGISDQTVKTHLKRLFRVLGARDRAHVVALACTGQVQITVRQRTIWEDR